MRRLAPTLTIGPSPASGRGKKHATTALPLPLAGEGWGEGCNA
jgi:hypothetical protein